MQRIAIVGAGSLGQQIAQHAVQNGLAVVGFLDDTLPKAAIMGLGQVLGSIPDALQLYRQGAFDGLLMGIGHQHLRVRQELFERLAEHVPFATFVHPTVMLEASATLGAGCFISPGCILDLNVRLGPNVFLYPGCVIAHDTVVEGHALFAAAVNLAGRVHVAERCFLGIGTTVTDNLRIGPDVRTGGGAVVVRSIAEAGTYVGVPARLLPPKPG